MLGTVMATLFTESFITDLTADANARFAELARRPIPSAKKLEQEIANEDRRLERLTDRLAKLADLDEVGITREDRACDAGNGRRRHDVIIGIGEE